MNFNQVETLALLCKKGDTRAKEELMLEFTPLILNLCKKSYVNSFEFEDIKNECYKTLFKCVRLYDPSKHRFVAYATNAIKNSVNYLIRTSIRREGGDGPNSLILDNKLEHILSYDISFIDDKLFHVFLNSKLNTVVSDLCEDERDLIIHVFYKKQTLKKYAQHRGIPYHNAINIKRSALNNLKRTLGEKENYLYLN